MDNDNYKLMQRITCPNKNIVYRYDEKLKFIVKKKEIINKIFYGVNFYYNRLFKCVTLEMVHNHHEMLYKITIDHNMILYRFLMDMKKIETRARNKALQAFMNHINVCEDIKNKIYSYL